MWVEANEFGFVLEFQTYTSKVQNGTIEQKVGAKAVTDFTRTLVGKYHQIYMGNHFSSVPLFIKLQEQELTEQLEKRGRIFLIIPNKYDRTKIWKEESPTGKFLMKILLFSN